MIQAFGRSLSILRAGCVAMIARSPRVVAALMSNVYDLPGVKPVWSLIRCSLMVGAILLSIILSYSLYM